MNLLDALFHASETSTSSTVVSVVIGIAAIAFVYGLIRSVVKMIRRSVRRYGKAVALYAVGTGATGTALTVPDVSRVDSLVQTVLPFL